MNDTCDTILIVDDMEINRIILRAALEPQYQILEAENGEKALLLLDEYHEKIALLLLDIMMPVKNGYEVMGEMEKRGLLAQIPVIMMTAEGTAENEVRAFDLGASDLVTKPFEPHVIKRRVENIIELDRHRRHLEDLVNAQAQSLRESNDIVTDALTSVIEHRSMESGQHILRIRMFTKILLNNVAVNYREYGLDEHTIELITRASAMHDVGKIAIPDAILNKPGPLTKEEFEVMKTHTIKGCEVLDSLHGLNNQEYLQYAYNICRYHHERADGRGYPEGLRGDNIPICAQVVSIADCYDALTTDRVYKKAFAHEKAFNMILNGECGFFSSKLLECLKNVAEAFRDLAKKYADGRSPNADFEQRMVAERPNIEKDAVQSTQSKYFSLLRYLNACVMEIDFDSNIYHMVYTLGQDFDIMDGSDGLREMFVHFIQTSIHPEDRGEPESELTGDMDAFFTSGAAKSTRNYRVMHRSTGTYHLYRLTALRVNMENPKKRHALLIWRDMDSEDMPSEDVIENNESFAFQIPGCVIQRRHDSGMTIERVGAGFASLFGYNETELKTLFDNQFLSIVYVEDREGLYKRICEQLDHSDLLNLEYRVVHKDGTVFWVLEKGQLAHRDDADYLCSVIVNIAEQQKEREELQIALDRYNTLTRELGNVVFDWDPHTDEIVYSDSWMVRFGHLPSESEKRGSTLLNSQHFHPQDESAVRDFFGAFKAGVAYQDFSFRFADVNGKYLNCHACGTAVFDKNGALTRVIGMIWEVDEKRKHAPQT